jgi:hypothetical protein
VTAGVHEHGRHKPACQQGESSSTHDRYVPISRFSDPIHEGHDSELREEVDMKDDLHYDDSPLIQGVPRTVWYAVWRRIFRARKAKWN